MPTLNPAAHRRAMRRRELALAATCPTMGRQVAAAGRCDMAPVPGFSPFHALARAITHQQLNGTAAQSIFRRLVALYAPAEFPAPAQLLASSDAELRACGLSYSKIAALRDLARKVEDGTVPTAEAMHALADEEIIARVAQVRGIGRWTVEMMLMFQLGRGDVLPVDDFGVCSGFRLAYGLKGMPLPRALAEFGARWAPHRSIAAWYLWRAVELARDGRLPQPPRAPRVALKKSRPPAAQRKSSARRKPAKKRKPAATRKPAARRR
jgi:DNA-3-methyladenine glycosylase II